MSDDPTTGGPWWVSRGSHTGHIVMDGAVICGQDVEIRHSHVCEPLDEADLRGPRHVTECGSCHRVARSRGWLAEVDR